MILQDAEAAEARTALQEVVTSVLARTSPRTDAVAHAEAAAAGGADTALWSKLSQDIGVVGLAVPEQWGGSGASFAETAVVFEQCGRWLTTVPLFGSWLAAEAIVRGENADAAQAWVPALAEGSIVGAVAFPDQPILATQSGEGWVLTGDVDLVVDGVAADVLVVPAQTPSGSALVLIHLDGVARSQQEGLDMTRQFARVKLEGAPATALAVDDEAVALTELLRDLAAVALACEQLGAAEQALADAVSYAGEREQFGRPIGSFQALKHLLADMATAADLARSLLEHAVWAATERPDQLREAAAMAFLQTSRAACFITAENIQVHGGIGFSWEHTAHLYFRKARSNAALLGDRSFFSDRLLAELGVLESTA